MHLHKSHHLPRSNKDAITLDRLMEAQVWVIAGPRDMFTGAEVRSWGGVGSRSWPQAARVCALIGALRRLLRSSAR